MSSSQGQNEPSMEEILASIRRIISEDDAAPAEEAAAPAGDKAASAPEEAAEAAPAEDDDDVLELTEMLDADGNVVDLTQADAEAEGEAEDVEVEFEDEPGAWPELTDPEPAADPEEAAVEEEVSADEMAADPFDVEPEPEDEPEPELEVEDAFAAAIPEELDETEQDTADMVSEDSTAGGPLAGNEGLVSETTAAAAALALSEVSRNARLRAGLGGIGGSPTLDAIVREALEPYLKSWLDENLPTLVERIVREEVRRLARRVEDE